MQKIIVSDTSCLILLHKIDELKLLHQLYGNILTTKEVADEYGFQLPDWIEIKQPKDKNYQNIVEELVDLGEASAIALAVENKNSLLIIDDLKGRKLANQLGLNIIGTLGVIVDAKLAGKINSIKPVLEKIKKTNFRLSEKIEILLMKRAGE